MEASVSYANTENRRSEPAAPVFLQTGRSSFVAVPTALQTKESNSDIITGSVGLRYGLTGRTEIYGNAAYLWRENRSFSAGEIHTEDHGDFSNLSLGVSHTFAEDGKNPALIGFAEGTVYEKSYGKTSLGKSWLAGLSTYKAVDPVILSLTAAYRFNATKNTSFGKYKAGNYFLLNPSVSFAANDRVSLSGGVQWIDAQPERIGGRELSARNTATYASFGVGYGVSRSTALNLSARFGISGRNSSEMRLSVQHKFE